MASSTLMEAGREQLRALEAEARELEVKANAVREQAVKDGKNLLVDQEAFAAVDAAYKARDLKNNEIKELTSRMAEAQGWEAGPATGNVAGPTAMDFHAFARQMGVGRPERMGTKFTASKNYKEFQARIANASDTVYNQMMANGMAPFEVADREQLAATMQFMATTVTGSSATSAGPFIQNDLIPGFVAYQRKRPLIASLFPWGTTDSDTIEYVTQTSVSSGAAETNEDTQATESAVAFATNTTSVREITHWIPVTKIAMADAGQVASIVDNELVLGVIDKLDTQLYSGSGTPPALKGINQYSGIGTQPLGGDTRPDAIHKAITTIRIAAGVLAEPDYIGMHPTDWQSLRLEKDDNGAYLFGPPNLPGPREAWGVPVVVSTVFTQGQLLVGDFGGSARGWMREGVNVTTGLDGNDFTKRRVTMLASMRLAFAVTREAGFTVVTGF